MTTDFEPYEFMHTNVIGNTNLCYGCYREGCKGRPVRVDDRNTHNNYHNHVDNGLPNPYTFTFSDEPSLSF